jgi:hypothetical protein
MDRARHGESVDAMVTNPSITVPAPARGMAAHPIHCDPRPGSARGTSDGSSLLLLLEPKADAGHRKVTTMALCVKHCTELPTTDRC